MSEATTPPFLLWAIGYQCPIRGFQDGSDPEMTERQLRAAIAAGHARNEGRVFEGYAVDEPLGFRVEEALALYGGLAKVEATCGPCVANVIASRDRGALAGCVGMVALPADEDSFCRRIDAAIETLSGADEYSRLFSATQPKWYGFWIRSPLTGEQLDLSARVFDKLKAEMAFDEAMEQMLAASKAARDNKLPLYATLYPAGKIEANWWRLVPHCPRCKAAWNAIGRGRCDVCGYEGHAAPEKKRGARGRRPYLPLARLMGEQKADEFLQRYRSRLQ